MCNTSQVYQTVSLQVLYIHDNVIVLPNALGYQHNIHFTTIACQHTALVDDNLSNLQPVLAFTTIVSLLAMIVNSRLLLLVKLKCVYNYGN